MTQQTTSTHSTGKREQNYLAVLGLQKQLLNCNRAVQTLLCSAQPSIVCHTLLGIIFRVLFNNCKFIIINIINIIFIIHKPVTGHGLKPNNHQQRQETSLQIQPKDKTMSMALVMRIMVYLQCKMLSLREALEKVTLEYKLVRMGGFMSEIIKAQKQENIPAILCSS